MCEPDVIVRPMHRLLIIDDDEAARSAAARVARSLSAEMHVSVASDAETALREAKAASFDAILVDMNLGALRGEEVMAALRAAQVSAPIIFLTETVDAERVAAGIRSGAIDYIPKSALDAERLASALRVARRVADAEAVAEQLRKEHERNRDQLGRLVEASVDITRAETFARVAAATLAALASIFESDGHVALAYGARRTTAGTDRAEDPSEAHLFLAVVPAGPLAVGGSLSVRRATPEFDPSERLVAAHLWRVSLEATERLLLLEAAHERARERQEIVAIVSHDLRTPLQSFALGLDAVDLLAGDVARRRIAGPVARMTRSIGTMTRLLTDLLDVSRIHDAGLPIHLAPQRIEDLVDELCDDHMLLAEKKDLNVTSDVQPPELVVVCDAARLTQALGNLMANALRHTERGAISVRVRLVQGDRARFEVSDTGPGLALNVQARLFERLFQAETPQQSGSLGLGLFIVKGIVLAHGGTVGLESKPGKGATFWLELPRARAK